MDGIQELCKTYHVALRVTNFEIALATLGILRVAWVKSLRPEVLVQSIYALYPKDHTSPAVARALRSVAQVDNTPTRAHCREGGVGSAIRHMKTQSFIERDGLSHVAHRKGYGANVVDKPVWHAITSRLHSTLTADLMCTLSVCASTAVTAFGHSTLTSESILSSR